MRLRNTLRALLLPLEMALVLTPLGAQAEDFQLYFNSDSDSVISYDECRLKKSKSIYYDCGGSNGIKMVIYASPSGACTNTPGTDAIILLSERTVSSSSDCKGVLSINASTVVEEDCSCDATKSLQICAATKYQAYNYETLMTEWVENETVSASLTYDSKPPSAPTLSEVTAGDGALHVSYSGANDISHWEFCVEAVSTPEPVDDGDDPWRRLTSERSRPEPVDDGDDIEPEKKAGLKDGDSDAKDDADGGGKDSDGDGGSETSESESGTDTCTVGESPFADMNCFKTVTIASSTSTSSGKITGLQNGVTYRVTMVARDLAGNYSPASESLEATPTAVQDFFAAYVDAGGKEEGGYGCSALSAGGASSAHFPWEALCALMLFGMPLFFRQRNRAGAAELPAASRTQEEEK